MLTIPDFKNLLNHFKKFEVRYLVVGGYAVMKYTEPRYTKDLDIWVATDDENANAVFEALRTFGAPLRDLSPQDFKQAGYFYQLGRPPWRLDVMMSIPDVEFESCWNRREMVELEGTVIPFISKEDLIRSKKASARPQDLLDVEKLEKAES